MEDSFEEDQVVKELMDSDGDVPIQRLKYDVLEEVYWQYVNGGGSPWCLAHVCQRWRRDVFDSPRLWSGIYLTFSLDYRGDRRKNGKEICNTPRRLERILARAKGALLDIELEDVWSHDWLGLVDFEKMMGMIFERSGQWRSFHLHNAEFLIGPSYILPPSFYSRGFPELQSVGITIQCFNVSLPSRGLIPFLPVLKVIEETSIHLSSFHLEGPGALHDDMSTHFQIWKRLKRLVVIGVDPIFIRMFHVLLASCSELEELELEHCSLSSMLFPGHSREKYLWKLRKLSFNDCEIEGMKRFHFNHLVTLWITMSSGLNFKSKSLFCPMLQSLYFHGHNPEGLAAFDTPRLYVLGIVGTSPMYRQQEGKWTQPISETWSAAYCKIWSAGGYTPTHLPRPIVLVLRNTPIRAEDFSRNALGAMMGLEKLTVIDPLPDLNFIAALSKKRGMNWTFPRLKWLELCLGKEKSEGFGDVDVEGRLRGVLSERRLAGLPMESCTFTVDGERREITL